ncbi:TetR family transcriptional regulator [Paenibacillus pabuli]|uniref:TetR family transcriptional regulator n=1 Tax=Paenibacillus pabuli TaxID=1472 RepID=A0ABX9BCU9_9BACL|nr:TetR/AcrR family transcriptional regulator [Paenibacillus pabuli]RAI86139.1 TetR family transcriptional regulator [Paenibacillus pabuli]
MKNNGKKIDLRVTRTHKLLTMALVDLLCQKGQLFSNITINEICDKAMVHRTTFYKHFEDKFALLSFTLNQNLQDYLQMDVDERLKEPLQSVSKILFGSVLEKIVQNQKKDEAFNNFLIKYIGEIFRRDVLELKKRGKGYSLPIELVAEFHSGVISLLVTWWIHHIGDDVTAEQMDQYYYQLVNEKIWLE